MTELFGRLAPGADVESARAELQAVHSAIVNAHPETYAVRPTSGSTPSRCAIRSRRRARTVLLVLLAASG